MKSLLCCAVLISACLAQTSAPSAGKQKVLWQKLESSIQDVDQHLDGVMGLAIEDLTTGDHYFLHEDEVFAQASSIKISVKRPASGVTVMVSFDSGRGSNGSLAVAAKDKGRIIARAINQVFIGLLMPHRIKSLRAGA